MDKSTRVFTKVKERTLRAERKWRKAVNDANRMLYETGQEPSTGKYWLYYKGCQLLQKALAAKLGVPSGLDWWA